MLARVDGLTRPEPSVVVDVCTSDVLFPEDATELIEVAVVGLEAGPGGWGNEAMLIVLRTVRCGSVVAAFPVADDDRNVGTSGVEE